MNRGNLYLVGTVHIDLDGKERLDTLLDRLSPSVVALEFHKDRENMRSLRKSPEEVQKKIAALIDESGLNLNPVQKATLIESGCRYNDVIGYEFKSSRDYTQRNPDSRLEYIDCSVFANGEEELLMKNMFKQIVEEPETAKLFLERLNGGIDAYLENLRTHVHQIYQSAEEIAEFMEMIRDPETFERMKEVMPPQAVQVLEQVFNPQRDEAMSNRVRELYDGKSRLVAIVDLEHLLGLKTRVEDLKPIVMTLAEYNLV